MEKIKINSYKAGLNQNNNNVKITLLNKDRESVTPTNILCKDYFQEIFAYLLHDKYADQHQYGFHVNPLKYESLKNQDYYEIALKHKNNLIVEDELFFENIARFKMFCDYLSNDSIISSNFEVFRLPAQNDKIWTVIRINKEILDYTFVPSMLLLFVRHFLSYKSEFNFISDDNFEESEHLSRSFVRKIKQNFKILWLFKEHYNFNTDKSITECHNNTGINHCINYISLPKGYYQVLVYGTLRQGFGNHRLLEDSIYVDTKQLDVASSYNYVLKLYCLGGFPGLIYIRGNDYLDLSHLRLKYSGKTITVEQYIVDDITMKRLDQLEGYRKSDPTRGLYNRIQIGNAWIYIYNGTPREEDYIEHGDYKKYINEKTFSTTS